VKGYFDSLVDFLDASVKEGFIRSKHRQLLLRSERSDDLIDQFEAAASGATPSLATRVG
jgi:predicted Rossmann-fold nucleotide-binding protein